MSVPGPVQLDLGDIRELHLGDLRPGPDGAAVGSTEGGPFRLELFAAGIVRLRIGTSARPDYGLLVAQADPPPVAAQDEGGLLALSAGDLTVTIDPGQFSVTLARNGQTLLGPRATRTSGAASGCRDLPMAGRAGWSPSIWPKASRSMATARNGAGSTIAASGWFLERGCARGQCRDRLQELPLRLEPARLGAVRQHAGTGGARCRLCPVVAPFLRSPGRGRGARSVPDRGRRPRGVLERYTWLTGRPARVPRWSLGAWLSKAYHRDADELLAAARKVRELRLPDGRDHARRPRLAGYGHPLQLRLGPGPLSRPTPRDRRREGARPAPVRLGISPGLGARAAIFPELARRGFFLKHARDGRALAAALEPGAVRAGADPAAGECPRGLHQPRGVRLVARRARGPLRCRRRRDQDRLRRAGAGRSRLRRRQWRPWRPPAQCLSALYNRCVYEATRAPLRAGPGLRPVGLGREPALAGAMGRRPAVGLGRARGLDPRHAVLGRLGLALVRHRHRRLLRRPARRRAVHPLVPGSGLRLAHALPWHGRARALVFGEEALPFIRAALELRYRLIPYIEAAWPRAPLPACP